MNSHLLIQDLAIIMAISALTILFCHLIRLPVVLGYIVAGMIIGPYTPPHMLIKDVHGIETLSELGIIFLLFSIGLEFSLKKLYQVGLQALIIAFSEIVFMITIGYLIGHFLHWKKMDAIFLGAILAISSTTIIAKIFSQMKLMQEKFSQLVLGVLVVEDLLAIFIIALLSGFSSAETSSIHSIGIAIFKGGLFIGGVLLIGIYLIPRFIQFILKLKIPEITVVTILGLCFSVTILAAKCGFSTALGAFLIGALIAETKDIKEIIRQMEPLRDMFSAVFFMSVGMLIDPITLWEFKIPILLITIVTLFGKSFICATAAKLTKNDLETSVKIGITLAQIGEFSFIIARLGSSQEVTSPFLYSIAVSVSVLTTVMTPFLLKKSSAITHLIRRSS